MSRRSKNVRKRERQKRRYELRLKQSLQLPPKRTISSAELFELIERMAHICRDTIAELENPQPKV